MVATFCRIPVVRGSYAKRTVTRPVHKQNARYVARYTWNFKFVKKQSGRSQSAIYRLNLYSLSMSNYNRPQSRYIVDARERSHAFMSSDLFGSGSINYFLFQQGSGTFEILADRICGWLRSNKLRHRIRGCCVFNAMYPRHLYKPVGER